MKVPSFRRIQSVGRRIWRRNEARAVILMYHRVVELDCDPWGLAVSPKHFSEQMAALRRLGRPTHLLDLALAHNNGNILSNTIVVTFDDGYLDNLQVAKPLLTQYDVPATMFITTGKIGRRREFWWDELEQILLRSTALPAILELTLRERPYQWELGAAAQHGQKDWKALTNHKAWQVEPDSRLAFFYQVYRILQPLPEEVQQDALAGIAAWAGIEPIERETHRTVSIEELKELADEPLVEIGAHTVTHPSLAAHDLSYQQREIRESQYFLEKELGRPVKYFAYPYGDYAPQTISLVQDDFICACTTVEESVRLRCDRFQLPRFQVQDWSGDEFAHRLLDWL